MRQNIVCIHSEGRQTMIDSRGDPFKKYDFSIALDKIKIIDGHYISLVGCYRYPRWWLFLFWV
jgi:hypothetical protein